MSKSNLSLQEVMDVLGKSGYDPNSSGYSLEQGKPAVAEAVKTNLYGKAQPVIDSGKAAYLAQLDKISQMDQKLAGVYGDPTSPLYIERATARDKAVAAPFNTGIKAAASQSDYIDKKKQELEDNIKATMDNYDEITKLTKGQEAEAKRVEAENKKATTASDKSSRTIEGYGELTKAQYDAITRAGVNKDAKSVSEFFQKSPPEFRGFVQDQAIDGKIKGSLDAKKLVELRRQWNKNKQTASVQKEVSKAKEKKKVTGKGSKKALF